ncbi:MAG TPA: carboxypeptidase-like regulatory domain-containing protein [Saprospiraceae bacterium]|nr:carboxypeptidase-like regulatory domain-containing protein [Saprospiraceae bacterium]HMP24502.1 carboxypeptidase-like regulatory domain-containing protein [Saprospiraceae bacterium]
MITSKFFIVREADKITLRVVLSSFTVVLLFVTWQYIALQKVRIYFPYINIRKCLGKQHQYEISDRHPFHSLAVRYEATFFFFFQTIILKLLLLIILIVFKLPAIFCQTVNYVEGVVVCSQTQASLEYVNIGVINTTTGTVTDREGYFKLYIPQHLNAEKINISCIGYKNIVLDINQVLNKKTDFSLVKDIYNIDEITVLSKTGGKFETIGAKSTSKNIVTGWSNGSGKGGERGILIDLKKGKYLIRSVNFHVARNDFDSLLLRLHIRRLENELPSEEILKENVFILVKEEKGWISNDITHLNVTINQPVVASIEWLKQWGNTNQSAFLISSNYLSGTLYFKEASDDRWHFKKRFSPSIYLTLESLNDE